MLIVMVVSWFAACVLSAMAPKKSSKKNLSTDIHVTKYSLESSEECRPVTEAPFPQRGICANLTTLSVCRGLGSCKARAQPPAHVGFLPPSLEGRGAGGVRSSSPIALELAPMPQRGKGRG
jgi:hypothetical protein